MANSEQIGLTDMVEQYANRLEEALSSGELEEVRKYYPQGAALLYEMVGFLRAAAKASIKVNTRTERTCIRETVGEQCRCSNCKYEIGPHDAFCSCCGAKVVEA